MKKMWFEIYAVHRDGTTETLAKVKSEGLANLVFNYVKTLYFWKEKETGIVEVKLK